VPGDHVLAADDVGKANDPIGDETRMLDHVGRMADDAGNGTLYHARLESTPATVRPLSNNHNKGPGIRRIRNTNIPSQPRGHSVSRFSVAECRRLAVAFILVLEELRGALADPLDCGISMKTPVPVLAY